MASRLSTMPAIVRRQHEAVRLDAAAPACTLGNWAKVDLLAKVGGSDLAGLALARSASSRRELIGRGGATEESESAVDRALNGSPSISSPTVAGASSIARKPARAGAITRHARASPRGGHSHGPAAAAGCRPHARQGKYKKAVQGGLAFLGHSMRLMNEGGDLQAGGMMYSQGLATIALCEAFAMTKDRQLAGPGAGGAQLHRRGPGCSRRRLALHARHARRHVGLWLAGDGARRAVAWPI